MSRPSSGSVRYESDPIWIEANVMLPEGKGKKKHKLDVNTVIREEKERILKGSKIDYPVLYTMVYLGPQHPRKVLDDNLTILDCIPNLEDGDQIELLIGKRSSELERPPRLVNPEAFSIKMKPRK